MARYFFRKLWKPNRNTTNLGLGWLDLIAFPNKKTPKKIIDFDFKVEKWNGDIFELKQVEVNEKIFPVGDIWNDIFSFTQSEMRVSESFSFTSSQKPENLLRRIIQSTTDKNDIVMDFFLGVGTTIAVAHKLKRKWIGIEMGKHFYETYTTNNEIKLGVMGRMKWVLFGDQNISVLGLKRRPHISKDINWLGGGFFKYFELEQYEDVLQKAHYADGTLFDNPYADPYQQYVFLRDVKLLDALEVEGEQNRVSVHPERLYPNIDLAETLSQRRGKWIRRITAEWVEFEDGEKLSLTDPDWNLMKHLIWWE